MDCKGYSSWLYATGYACAGSRPQGCLLPLHLLTVIDQRSEAQWLLVSHSEATLAENTVIWSPTTRELQHWQHYVWFSFPCGIACSFMTLLLWTKRSLKDRLAAICSHKGDLKFEAWSTIFAMAQKPQSLKTALTTEIDRDYSLRSKIKTLRRSIGLISHLHVI